MIVYTIGFTQKSARRFFELLEDHKVRKLLDIRLNPYGQLSGFSKKDDLAYFLERLSGIDYHHLVELAPTDDILHTYRKEKSWNTYVDRFERLMDERSIPASLDRALFEDGPVCLLCSEDKPDRCHRRLVAERLAQSWDDVEIHHLI
ncbi:MAG TPA: DUF488 domain-containing protein [Thermomicrobiales bacterium]|nr:DUF488 domain-containing protein [Thermomicrobiales bacterium]